MLVRRSASELQLTFRLEGDISRILVPLPAAPQFSTELWQHTCFEAFIAAEGRSAYYELNFSPSGEWALYAFGGYRDGGPVTKRTTRPQVAVRSTDSSLELDALVRLDCLSTIDPRDALRVGLSAVIEVSDGFSYWALQHPADKPDFHNAEGFALLLEPLDSKDSYRSDR